MENIPAHIFDLIEKAPFDALNEEEQTEVLQYLTREECGQMYKAAQETKAFFAPSSSHDTSGIFASLNDKFDSVYGKPSKPSGLFTTVWVWKMAAGLLLLAVSYLSFELFAKQPRQNIVHPVVRDTVYIADTQFVTHEEKIHDTVFISLPSKRNEKPTLVSADTGHNTIHGLNSPLWLGYDLNTLSIYDKDSGANAPKNRSIANDTFVKSFGYVSL